MTVGGFVFRCAKEVARISVAWAFTKIVASVGRKVTKPSFVSGRRFVMAIHLIGLFFVVLAISALRFLASVAVAPVSMTSTPSPASIHEQFVMPNRPYQRFG